MTGSEDAFQAEDPSFRDAASPEVSVVLRISGTPEQAIRCLQALRSATAAIPVEWRVVVDGAQPQTHGMATRILGRARLRRVADGMARDALQTAAASTQAPFVWFVDDSAEVCAGSLSHLLDTMRTHRDCGAAGLKLLMPDGMVQQAGGVIWNDGTRCSYGVGDRADAAEINYARETDYCSGVALLVRREAMEEGSVFDDVWLGIDWAEVGLAFRLRIRGWKTLYCPRAIAVHHGHALSGGNLYGGERSAVIAGDGFRERWQGTLDRRHFPACKRMFRARERNQDGPTLLVVDHYLPQPERDAGSRAILQSMVALQSIGYRVKFWPANQFYATPERSLLEEAGIEIVAGDRWAGRFDRYIRYAGAELDAALLSRPEVAAPALPSLRAHSRARLLYYGHDLHHRRMAMRAEVTGDAEERAAAAAMHALERSIWMQVDAVIYPSREEAGRVAREVDPDKVHVVPLYAFTEEELTSPRAGGNGLRLLFVAGFGHSPNIDAAHWLAHDILPRVHGIRPDATLDLVGSHPTPEVRALGDLRGVTVTSDVSGEVLAGYYSRASVAIVPLRFGAGVKLKVLEAMARGVPVVTTPVGAQGLPEVENCIRIAADADALAEAVVAAALEPPDATEAARAYVRTHYGRSGIEQAFRRVLMPA